MSKEYLWHRRFGHLNVGSLQKLSRSNMANQYRFDYDPSETIGFCESCVKGKIHRRSFPTGGAKRSSEQLNWTCS